MGLINIVMLFPLFPIFHATGLETFEWPNGRAILFLSVNAFVGTFISDYCWARSVVLVGPLVTTLGISLTIPLSIVASSLLDNMRFSWLYFCGSVLIFLSFIVISFINYKEEKKKKMEEEQAH